jgi:hypothetical protein
MIIRRVLLAGQDSPGWPVLTIEGNGTRITSLDKMRGMKKEKIATMRRQRKRPVNPDDGTYVLQTKRGIVTVKVTEHPDHILVVGDSHLTRELSKREHRAFVNFLQPLLEGYESDPRPIWIRDETGTRQALVHKLGNGRIVGAMAIFPQ